MSEAPEGIPPMVHAVAEALRAECLRVYGSNWSYDVSWALARAAIEAMREPTDSMSVNGGLELEEQMFAQQGLVFDGAKAVFQKMIDVALAEPTAPR